MNTYESIIIVNPNLDEVAQKALQEKFMGLINENGSVKVAKNLGKKQLAYEINKFKEGIFIEFQFESKPEAIAELERIYRITDDIMKFITIKKED